MKTPEERAADFLAEDCYCDTSPPSQRPCQTCELAAEIRAAVREAVRECAEVGQERARFWNRQGGPHRSREENDEAYARHLAAMEVARNIRTRFPECFKHEVAENDSALDSPPERD